MESMAPLVRFHGHLGQPELAGLMRRCAVCVLPSFYEGLPLVLVEALACGCRLVSTALPGITEQLAPRLGPAFELVPLPRIEGVDRPAADDLPAFVDYLEAALEAALEKPPLGDPATAMPGALEAFTWKAVFERVESLWRELIEAGGRKDG
jgi:glycosyltransferase involved in cell wall biosynthesis